MKKKVLLVDVPRGGLASLAKDLANKGYAVERSAGEVPAPSPAGENLAGAVVHHKRAREVKKLRGLAGMDAVPIILWFPSGAGPGPKAAEVADDFMVGKVLADELLARFKAAEKDLKLKLPWLQDSLQALTRIGRSTAGRGSDFSVLAITAREVERVMPGVRCSIMMLSSKGGSGMVITQGDRPEPLNIRLEFKKYPEIRKMLDTRKPVSITNVRRHPLMKEVRDILSATDLFSILVVPIFFRDEVIGLIMLRSVGAPRPFERIEISFLEMVAQSTAVSLRNIRLGREVSEEVKRKREAKRLAKRKTSDLARMETLFDHASDGVLVVDSDGGIKSANVNFLRLSGYARREVEKRNIDDFLFPTPDDVVTVSMEIGRLGQEKREYKASRFSQVLRGKSGARLFVALRVESLPTRDEWLISMHDLTEERELEDALRRTKEFLENVINSSMDAIIAADMTGSIILFNAAAESISGYKAEDVVGRMSIVDFYAPGVARDIMRKLRSEDYGGKGKLESSYNTLISSDGREIPINISAAIVYEDGREVASVGIFQDQRERIRIEKELREAQEKLMESRQRSHLMALSGAAAHELNQPLTSILGYLELLRRVERNLMEAQPENPSVASLHNAAEVIGQEAERMAEVVRKIGQVTEFETREYVGGARIMDLDRAQGDRADENAPIWQTLFNHMKEAVFVAGEDTVVTMANPASVTFTGENPVGKSFTRYLKGQDYTLAMEAMERVKKGEAVPIEIEAEIPSGDRRLVDALALPIPSSGEMMTIYSDVTERRRLENEHRDFASFREQIYKNSSVPFIVFDVDSRITFWNRAAENLFGYAYEEVKGKNVGFLIQGFVPAHHQEHLRRLRKERDLTEEIRLVKKSGEVFRAYYVNSLMRDEDGKTAGFLSMIFDLTERRAFEAELRQKTEQITVMSDISDAVRAGEALEEVLGGALRKLSRVFPLDMCAVVVRDEAESELKVLNYVPEQGRLTRNVISTSAEPDVLSRVLFLDQPAVFDDVSNVDWGEMPRNFAREVKEMIGRGYKSLINYPLVFRGEVMGTLHALSSEKAFYGAEHLSRLSQFAGPITMSLANARLFNQIQKKNRDLSRRTEWMAELISAGQEIHFGMEPDEMLARLIKPYMKANENIRITAWLKGAEGGGLRLAAGRGLRRLGKARLELAEEYLDKIRSDNRILEFGDLKEEGPYRALFKKSKAAIIVPMTAFDQWLGVLSLESERPFSEEDKFEARVMAAHVAGVMRNLFFYHELDLSARYQRGLIDDANALILIIDRDGKIALINNALQELMGVSEEGYVGVGFGEIFERHLLIEYEGRPITAGDEKFRGLTGRVRRGESLANLRVNISTPAGQKSRAIFNTSSILDREGRFQGFIAIGQNITRYQELENHLLQAEKLATVGRMSAGIAHDLANPITSVINSARLLEGQSELSAKGRDRVECLIEDAERIRQLSQNLMSYARPSREQLFPVDAGRMIEESLSFSRYELERDGVTVEVEVPADLPPIRGIKDQLQQVFINLLVNASHACAEKGGGRVRVRGGKGEGDTVTITVEDDGAGISPEDLPRLFDPFFTTKPEGKGTGLGLSIIKEIISRHKGEVSVVSRPGEGATFTVVLPVFTTN